MDKNSKKERRKDERVETEIRAQFPEPSDFINNFIGNVSKGGILVKTGSPLKVNEEFRLRFSIKGIEKTFEAVCRVMWIQELYDKYADRMLPAMGCRFVDLPEKDLKIIEDFILSKSSSSN